MKRFNTQSAPPGTQYAQFEPHRTRKAAIVEGIGRGDSMDAVYPAAASALARGRRLRRATPRIRHRTAPVTFAEIKEVDEDKEEAYEENRASVISVASAVEERRRRPDVLSDRLDERLDREFAAFRRRRARRQPLREPDELCVEQPEPAVVQQGVVTSTRAASEPRAGPAPV